MKIAIDGPAASGKSTLGEAIAKWLGYLYFDTGVMYRAVTLAALNCKTDLRDEVAVTTLAQAVKIEVTPSLVDDGRQYTVWLDGVDVTWQLRLPEVDASVSIPSSYAGVRQEMVQQQQRIARRGNLVMVGRDIGTIVLPDADIKIYLEASVEERARRRYLELLRRGEPSDITSVLSAMCMRDEIDKSRSNSPLQPAADAMMIDSTGRDIDEVIRIVQGIISSYGITIRRSQVSDDP